MKRLKDSLVLGIILISQIACKSLQKITVIGTAFDVKAGALIMTNDSIGYFVRGLEVWPNEFKNKQVKISGRLKIVKRPENAKPGTIQFPKSDMKIIVNSKYKLIE